MEIRLRILACLILSVLPTFGLRAQSANDQEWQTLSRNGINAARAGRSNEARTLLESALKQSENNITLEEKAVLLKNLGWVDLNLSDYSAAEPLLIEAMDSFRKAEQIDSGQYIDAMETLGRLYWRMGKFDKARPLLLKSLELQKKVPTLPADFIAVRMENLGEFYFQQGELDSAEVALRDAIELRRAHAKAASGLSGAYLRLADVLVAQGKFAEAQKLAAPATLCAESQFGAGSEQAKAVKDHMAKILSRSSRPALTIFRPKTNEVFKNEPIVAAVEVTNFQLKQPEPIFGKQAEEGTGHIHYLLDDHPPIATHATQIMFEGGPAFMKEGDHTLWVELVDEKHHPLTPPIRQRVHFQIQR